MVGLSLRAGADSKNGSAGASPYRDHGSAGEGWTVASVKGVVWMYSWNLGDVAPEQSLKIFFQRLLQICRA
jgi:hypothetical protein